ncbi:MAG: UDP-galactopyranose mutase [Chryseolinea sp.]
MNILIVGAGFSGAVIAECLTRSSKHQVTVIESRSHLGGNCHTQRDLETGIMLHTYGPHIFNTDNLEVWQYISRFCEMMPYTNRVKTVYENEVYSFPINLHTINQFFKKNLNPESAREFLKKLADATIDMPENFEQQALKFVGPELYHAFLYGYTKKQWGCEPSELPASILKRLPVRFNYNDNYYSTKYQGIPKNGYTPIFEQMFDRENIKVLLNTKFNAGEIDADFDHIFYTGPIDELFHYRFGRLGYRTVFFNRFDVAGDHQGNAVINYADVDVPYTRVHEHKHFTPWESHDRSVYFEEFSKETTEMDVPYYPKRLSHDMDLLKLYQIEASKVKRYTMLGRLATYRYMDMHHVIGEALRAAEEFELNHT